MTRLSLPDITLCAVASVNVAATAEALRLCLEQADFGSALLLTDRPPAGVEPGIEVRRIDRLPSAEAYSHFMLKQLAPHIATSHCLVVQWDGFIIDPRQWRPDFLEFDYIGAPWPQFDDGHEVGNGGFSLRSRRLLELCRDPAFEVRHPEDIAICRLNRDLVEARKLRIADAVLAQQFAYERTPAGNSFGFHGIFNLIPVLGPEKFWSLYRSLDDRTSAAADWRLLVRQMGGSKAALGRQMRIALDAAITKSGR
ncbi:hypothetical protein G7077_03345 [Sphingomonas piscis]|uniref:DUF5672 domain-containing protein n=1 Tax=Sphingomonas piscis TaxID=2714943 RepID=A0A6G7YMX1_9SPHN|nr:DUF5672 family protein [Sphingomonas piscis]QIK78090.1 hypothetical protein G7077_03345 [Sphingomonas piscis]